MVGRRGNMDHVIVSVYRLSRIFLERSRLWLGLRNAGAGRRLQTPADVLCLRREFMGLLSHKRGRAWRGPPFLHLGFDYGLTHTIATMVPVPGWPGSGA